MPAALCARPSTAAVRLRPGLLGSRTPQQRPPQAQQGQEQQQGQRQQQAEDAMGGRGLGAIPESPPRPNAAAPASTLPASVAAAAVSAAAKPTPSRRVGAEPPRKATSLTARQEPSAAGADVLILHAGPLGGAGGAAGDGADDAMGDGMGDARGGGVRGRGTGIHGIGQASEPHAADPTSGPLSDATLRETPLSERAGAGSGAGAGAGEGEADGRAVLPLLAEFEARAAIESISAERVARALGVGAGAAVADRACAGRGGQGGADVAPAAEAAAAHAAASPMASSAALSLRRPAAERLRLITASAAAATATPAARPATAGALRARIRPADERSGPDSRPAERTPAEAPQLGASGSGDELDEHSGSGPLLTRRLVRLLQEVAAERDGLRRELARAREQIAALEAARDAPSAQAAAAASGGPCLGGSELAELQRLRVESGNLWQLLDENKALRAQLKEARNHGFLATT